MDSKQLNCHLKIVAAAIISMLIFIPSCSMIVMHRTTDIQKHFESLLDQKERDLQTSKDFGDGWTVEYARLAHVRDELEKKCKNQSAQLKRLYSALGKLNKQDRIEFEADEHRRGFTVPNPLEPQGIDE